MKHSLKLFLALLLSAVVAHSQNLPNSSGLPSGTMGGIVTSPANFNSSPNTSPTSYNFTRTYVPLIPVTSIAGYSTVPTAVQVSTDYTDSWGESIMTVTRNHSGQDIISPHYNRPSRTVVNYLPYTVSPGSKFRTQMFSEQTGFYTSLYPLESTTAYSKTIPQTITGRPYVFSYAPGKTHVGQVRGTTEYAYANDNMEVWMMELNSGGICSTGNYAADQIWVRTTTDAEGGTTKIYTDKSSRTICKKTACSTATGGWLTTYYVYSAMGKIVATVPPKASELFMGVGAVTCISDPSKLCFLYTYDDFGNLIRKSTPGKSDEELIAYDAKKRAVLSQTPLLKAQNKWAFSVLDQQGRTMYSGLVTSTATETYWRGVLAGTQTPNSYLDGSSQPVPASQTLEYALTHSFTTYPSSLFSCDILTYNYYDDYTAAPSPANGVTYSTALSSNFLTGTQMVTPAPYYFTQGKLVATHSRILDNGYTNNFTNATWITSVFFYDEKGRVIQTQTLNPWNTTTWDINATQYNFAGSVVLDMIRHNSWTASNKTQTTIRTKNNYGYSTGRLESTEQSIDGEAWRTIASYTYDAFGKVTKKWLGSVEEQHYSYNIRNQMTGINSPDPLLETVTSGMSPTESYKESLHYETAFSDPRYDGALTGYRWRTRSSNTYAYGYDYDEAGRMTRAEFREYSPDTSNGYTVQWNKSKRDFTTYNITYDANGNINTLAQKGYNSSMGNSVIDNLSYTYDAGTNVLRKVTEAGVNTTSVDDFSNGTSGTADDYTYDGDGNLTSDLNKGLATIAYTFQDLPQSVSKNGTNYVHNIYDASGTLLQKQIKEGSSSPVVTYRYWGPFVYVDDKLDYIGMPEGRVRYIPDSSLLRRDYFVKDHLGNVRTVVTADEYTLTHDYLATHEVASANLEESIFSNIAEVRDVRPEAAPGDMRAAGLDGTDSSRRIGTAIVLKVMAGDKISVGAWAWNERKTEEDVYTQPSAMLGTLISTLSGGVGGFSGGEEGNGAETVGNLFSTSNYMHAYEDIKTSTTNAANPRSYLNYLVFDREMNLVESQSGAIQVDGTASQWRYISLPYDLVLSQSGYIAVYISDEDKVKVAWDDVQVIHTKGRLLEESHYYPHGGLYMHQSPDAGMPKDQYGHQDKKLQQELGMQLYDFGPRQYDPQIGRFWGLDPADQYPSGYTGMGNDPANMIDPSGCYATSSSQNPFFRENWSAWRGLNYWNEYAKWAKEAEASWAKEAWVRSSAECKAPVAMPNEGGWQGSTPGGDADAFIKYNETRAAVKAKMEQEQKEKSGEVAEQCDASNNADLEMQTAQANIKDDGSEEAGDKDNAEENNSDSQGPLLASTDPGAGALKLLGKGLKFGIGATGGIVFEILKAVCSPIEAGRGSDRSHMIGDTPEGNLDHISKREMKTMQEGGFEPHDHKPQQGGPGGNIDFYKDQKGWLFYKTNKGTHYEPIFENFYMYYKP